MWREGGTKKRAPGDEWSKETIKMRVEWERRRMMEDVLGEINKQERTETENS